MQAALDAVGGRRRRRGAMPRREVIGLSHHAGRAGQRHPHHAGSTRTPTATPRWRPGRLPGFTGLPGYSGMELVRLEPGASLVHVWVDGQRDAPDPNDFSCSTSACSAGGDHGRRRPPRQHLRRLDPRGRRRQSGVPGGVPCSRQRGLGQPGGGLLERPRGPAGRAGHRPPAGRRPRHLLHPHPGAGQRHRGRLRHGASSLFDGASFLASAPPSSPTFGHNMIVSAGNSYSFGIVTDPSYSLDRADVPAATPPGVTSRRCLAGGRSTAPSATTCCGAGTGPTSTSCSARAPTTCSVRSPTRTARSRTP